MDRELRLSMQGRSVAQAVRESHGAAPTTVNDLSVTRKDVQENPRRVLKRLEQYGIVVVEGALRGEESENGKGRNSKPSLCHQLDQLLFQKARKLRESGEAQASNYGGPEDSCGDIHGGDCRPGMDSCRIDMKMDLDEHADNDSSDNDNAEEVSLVRQALRRALGDARGDAGTATGAGLARILLGFFGNAGVLMEAPQSADNKFLVQLSESQSLSGLCELAALVVSPGAPGQCVHSDSSWYHGKSAVTCFAAVHDVEHAPTRVFPFTHCIPEAHSPEGRKLVAEKEKERKEKEVNIETARDLDNIDASTAASTDTEAAVDKEDSFLSDVQGVSLFLKRGDIAVMDSRLLHYGTGWDECSECEGNPPNSNPPASDFEKTKPDTDPDAEPHRTLFYFTVCQELEDLPVGSTITILQKYLKEEPLLLANLEKW